MEGFKNSSKIKYFKEGGFVTSKTFTAKEKKEDKIEIGKDIKKDTKLIKKGVSQHESALHKGEPKTELKLKTGGRAKKDCGTVKKYKTGGTVEVAYGAKKTDKDIKDIANTKRQKPQMLCGGSSVKKYQAGGGVMGALTNIKNKVMGTPEQNAIAAEKEKEYLKAKMAQQAAGAEMGAGEKMAMGLAGLGQKLRPAAPAAPAPAPAGATQPMEVPAQKKGGKVKKACK